jgi:hypothetical protein
MHPRAKQLREADAPTRSLPANGTRLFPSSSLGGEKGGRSSAIAYQGFHRYSLRFSPAFHLGFLPIFMTKSNDPGRPGPVYCLGIYQIDKSPSQIEWESDCACD